MANFIHIKKGNIFDSKAQGFINPVNCVGVMGAGLAKQFKDRHPDNYMAYELACANKSVLTGRMFVFKPEIGPKYIINFPTKRHWKSKSKMEYIETGLYDLVKIIKTYNISSIAIPAIGSGLGGLKWTDVENKIITILSDSENIDIEIYAPY